MKNNKKFATRTVNILRGSQPKKWALGVALVTGSLMLQSGASAQGWGAILDKLNQGKNAVNEVVNAYKSIAQATQLPNIPVGDGLPPPSENRIVIYRAAYCGYCKAAEKYMKDRGIGFVMKDVQTDPVAQKEASALGARGVPLILFGRKAMAGFNASLFDRNYQEFTGKPVGPPLATSVGGF